MAAYVEKCRECGREFTNYDAAPKLRCSVYCDGQAARRAIDTHVESICCTDTAGEPRECAHRKPATRKLARGGRR